MRRLLFLLLAALLCPAERVVLRDNTVQTGTLTGVEGANLVIRTASGAQRIPLASIAAILFDDGTAAPVVSAPNPISGAANPISPVVSANVQSANGLRVELIGCSKQATTAVRCEFTVTNTGVDRQIRLSGSGSSFVDATGFERRGTLAILGAAQNRAVAATTLVSNVATRATLQFPGVEPGVNSLARLSVVWVAQRQFEMTFRNIPLQGN